MTRARAAVLLLPAFAVAVGAVIATAHGLFAVADAAKVPFVIAWLYPLITDGLALVAYAATHQLADKGKRYAWCVVVLAAVLSGLAQAVFLAGGAQTVAVSPELAFGVGAWPAVAAAIVAHLVYLLAHQPDAPPFIWAVDEAAPFFTSEPEPDGPDEPDPEHDEKDEQPRTVLELVKRREAEAPSEPDRAAELIGAGAGRKKLARELGISEYEARRMIDEARQG